MATGKRISAIIYHHAMTEGLMEHYDVGACYEGRNSDAQYFFGVTMLWSVLISPFLSGTIAI
jgi:hypothetical protein